MDDLGPAEASSDGRESARADDFGSGTVANEKNTSGRLKSDERK
jgi:hypothetical protein